MNNDFRALCDSRASMLHGSVFMLTGAVKDLVSNGKLSIDDGDKLIDSIIGDLVYNIACTYDEFKDYEQCELAYWTIRKILNTKYANDEIEIGDRLIELSTRMSYDLWHEAISYRLQWSGMSTEELEEVGLEEIEAEMEVEVDKILGISSFSVT